jgi:Transposase DDE domain group 1
MPNRRPPQSYQDRRETGPAQRTFTAGHHNQHHQYQAPVIAGMRLRAGETGSGKGAGRMVAQAASTARDAGANGQILVRDDSAYGTRTVIKACTRRGVQFSLVMAKSPAVQRDSTRRASCAVLPHRLPLSVIDPAAATAARSGRLGYADLCSED